MERYQITITGLTPLLMHHDDVEWADVMDAWKNNAANKKGSKAGDDRSPAWRWIGALYHDGNRVCLPLENIMRTIMEGGAMVPVPGGKNGKTFKSQSQSGIQSPDPYWPLTVFNEAGQARQIDVKAIHALMQTEEFARHKETAADLGFSLFVKRAKVGTSKHIRVRPRFDRWAVNGELDVLDKQITEAVLRDILTYAGQYKGLGDWRPGGKTPGCYGMFRAEVERIKG